MSVPSQKQRFRFVAKQATNGALWGAIVGLYLNLMGLMLKKDALSSPEVVLVFMAAFSFGGILVALFWLWYLERKK